MTYRVNVQYKDGSTNGPAVDIVTATPPRRGETISVAKHGLLISVRVTAIWTPRLPGSKFNDLVMVEAQEV